MLKNLVRSTFDAMGFELRRIRSHHVDAYKDQALLLADTQVKTVFDVGACTGETVETYRRLFTDAHVYGFEPTDSSFGKLKNRFAGDASVTPIHAAVGESSGSATLYLNEYEQTNSLLPNANGAQAIVAAQDMRPTGQKSVPIVTIDAFCAEKNVQRLDVLKMDIQGFELHALRGARGLLERQQIGLIYCEVLFSPLYEGQAFYDEIAGYLRALGYSLYGLYTLMRGRNGALGWADAIFLGRELQRRHGIPSGRQSD